MTDKLNTALTNVEVTYGELVEIANDMTKPIFEPIDEIVQNISDHANAMPVDSIRDNILTLQLKAFEISEIKEKSALKAELAEALQKEKFAVQFNSFDGSAAAKEKLALVATSEETTVSVLYDLVANLFKNKVDQLHRLVAALTSILVSRGQEAKFMQMGATSEVSNTTNSKTILNEWM